MALCSTKRRENTAGPGTNLPARRRRKKKRTKKRAEKERRDLLSSCYFFMRILFSTCAPASGVTSSTGFLSLDTFSVTGYRPDSLVLPLGVNAGFILPR